MRASVLGQIPQSDASGAVAADDLSLIRVDNNVVCRRSVVVASLDGSGTGFPDLDGSVLRACYHPLALAVEGHAGHVAGVALEGHEGLRVCGTNVKEFDIAVAGSGEVSLVRGYAKTVHLRLGVLDGARADSRERLPEPDGVVVTSCKGQREAKSQQLFQIGRREELDQGDGALLRRQGRPGQDKPYLCKG